MPVLPWSPTDDDRIGGRCDEVVVLASRLHLRRRRDVPGFMRAAFAIRRQVLRSPGAIGVSLHAQPAARTFWTLSAWTDEHAIGSFVGQQPHRDVMAKYHDRLEDAEFTTWTTDAAALPRARRDARDLWVDARRHLAAARLGVTTNELAGSATNLSGGEGE